MPDGRVLDISRLICLVQGREPESIPFSQVRGVSRSSRTGFSKRRLERTDTAIPGIVDQTNRILDGRHRVLKLQANGNTSGLFWKASAEEIEQAIIGGEEV
jgi:hypothetical protein